LKLRVRLDGQTVWLPQRLIAELFDVSVKTANEHLVNIYDEGELAPEATIRKFRIVQIEGTRQVSRLVDHYSLEAIVAVGLRVRSGRGTAFRQWSIARLTELLTKGFTLDDERIKAGLTLGDDYFEELLARIRDIRSSERLFYQKITDIYATSIDYDKDSPTTVNFFATVQNKLHWAIHGHTAAEIVRSRADADKPHMGLTTWKNAPTGPVRKRDVTVAKNYLTQDELEALNRIVSMYLDFAEDQARRKKTMRMADWAVKLDAFLEFNERNILKHYGKVSKQLADEHAHAEFAKFDAERLRLAATEPTSDFDRVVDEMKRLEQPPTPAPKGKKIDRKKKDGRE
jgi:hypothetical protein